MPYIGETTEGNQRPGEGWLECIGLSLSRAEYPELFEKIGTKHGSLNAASFNLPSVPHQYIYAGSQAASIPETLPDTDPVRPGEPNLRRGEREAALNADVGADAPATKPVVSAPVVTATSQPKTSGSAAAVAAGPKAKG